MRGEGEGGGGWWCVVNWSDRKDGASPPVVLCRSRRRISYCKHKPPPLTPRPVCPLRRGHLAQQEVFQQACANHYTEDPVPMVFLGTDFWGGDNGVVSLLRATAVGRPFADHILLTDGFVSRDTIN